MPKFVRRGLERWGETDISLRERLRHRFFAVLLSIGILALLVSTAALVINSVTRTPSAGSSSTIPRSGHALNLTRVLSSYLKSHGHFSKKALLQLERPYITFIGGTLSPSDNRLKGTLEIIIPPGVPPFMLNKGQSMFTCPTNGSCTPLPQYADDTIDATMLVSNAGTNYEKHELLKLKDLFSTSILGLHEFPVDIPVKGYAGRYPQDEYTADVSLALAFPGKTTFEKGPRRQVQTVQAGTLGNIYAIATKPTSNAYQKIVSNAKDTFSLTIGREWYDQFFVYTVALIPALFALLFFHLLFFATGEHGIGRSFEHFTEALVLSVLSVLPLRVVLVPSDISGLTRVDLTLAVGLVLIVAVAAGRYVREVWAANRTPDVTGAQPRTGSSTQPEEEVGTTVPAE